MTKSEKVGDRHCCGRGQGGELRQGLALGRAQLVLDRPVSSTPSVFYEHLPCALQAASLPRVPLLLRREINCVFSSWLRLLVCVKLSRSAGAFSLCF